MHGAFQVCIVNRRKDKLGIYRFSVAGEKKTFPSPIAAAIIYHGKKHGYDNSVVYELTKLLLLADNEKMITHYVEKLSKITDKAKLLADKGDWKELEDHADSQRGTFLRLCSQILSVKTGSRVSLNSDDDLWEAFSTLTGTHEFKRDGIRVVIFPVVSIDV